MVFYETKNDQKWSNTTENHHLHDQKNDFDRILKTVDEIMFL